MSDAQRLYDALKRITQYMPPDKLRKVAERKYGLSEDEAIEFAYENVLAEAAAAIKGMRRPADRAQASWPGGADAAGPRAGFSCASRKQPASRPPSRASDSPSVAVSE